MFMYLIFVSVLHPLLSTCVCVTQEQNHCVYIFKKALENFKMKTPKEKLTAVQFHGNYYYYSIIKMKNITRGALDRGTGGCASNILMYQAWSYIVQGVASSPSFKGQAF